MQIPRYVVTTLGEFQGLLQELTPRHSTNKLWHGWHADKKGREKLTNNIDGCTVVAHSHDYIMPCAAIITM
jgi:hypothetical protein